MIKTQKKKKLAAAGWIRVRLALSFFFSVTVALLSMKTLCDDEEYRWCRVDICDTLLPPSECVLIRVAMFVFRKFFFFSPRPFRGRELDITPKYEVTANDETLPHTALPNQLVCCRVALLGVYGASQPSWSWRRTS